MKKLMLVPALFAFMCMGLLGCNQQQEATEQAEEINEERFDDDMEDVAEELTEIYGVNQMIIEIAQIAQGNSSLSQSMMDINETILKDHQNLKDQLTQLASQKNIALPNNINYGESSELNELKEADADEFAEEYIEILTQASDDMERKLEDIEDELEGSSPEISSFVQSTMPVIRSHEQSVDNIDEEI